VDHHRQKFSCSSLYISVRVPLWCGRFDQKAGLVGSCRSVWWRLWYGVSMTEPIWKDCQKKSRSKTFCCCWRRSLYQIHGFIHLQLMLWAPFTSAALWESSWSLDALWDLEIHSKHFKAAATKKHTHSLRMGVDKGFEDTIKTHEDSKGATCGGFRAV